MLSGFSMLQRPVSWSREGLFQREVLPCLVEAGVLLSGGESLYEGLFVWQKAQSHFRMPFRGILCKAKVPTAATACIAGLLTVFYIP